MLNFTFQFLLSELLFLLIIRPSIEHSMQGPIVQQSRNVNEYFRIFSDFLKVKNSKKKEKEKMDQIACKQFNGNFN